MIVAGVMSGTSADGINVALVRIGDGRARSATSASDLRGRAAHADTVTGASKIKLLGYATYSYPAKVRAAILAAMNAERARVADMARLNFLLGELYADAVLATERKFRVKADLVGCHGQTLYHQGELQPFLGKKIAATWQTGEAAVISARVGVPVVSDFRPADMALAAKERRWFPISITCSFVTLKSAASCKTLAESRTLRQFPRELPLTTSWPSTPDREIW